MEQAGKHRLWSRHKSRTFLWPDSVGRALAFRRIVVEIVYEDASQPSIHFLYEVSYLIIWLLFSLPLLFSQLLFFSFSWARKKITGSTSIIPSNYIHSTGVYIIYTPYIGETNLSSTPYTYSVRSIRKTIMHNAYIKNNNPCTCIGFAAKLGKARPTGWTTRHVKSTDQAPADWFWTGGGSAALAPVLRVTPAPGVPSCDYTRLSTSAPSGGPRSMEKEWWCLVLPQYVWGSKADSLEHQSINPCHVYASYCLFSVIIRSTMYEWVLLPRKTRHTPRLTPIHTHTHTHLHTECSHYRMLYFVLVHILLSGQNREFPCYILTLFCKQPQFLLFLLCRAWWWGSTCCYALTNISWRSGQAKILASHWAIYVSQCTEYMTYEYRYSVRSTEHRVLRA